MGAPARGPAGRCLAGGRLANDVIQEEVSPDHVERTVKLILECSSPNCGRPADPQRRGVGKPVVEGRRGAVGRVNEGCTRRGGGEFEVERGLEESMIDTKSRGGCESDDPVAVQGARGWLGEVKIDTGLHLVFDQLRLNQKIAVRGGHVEALDRQDVGARHHQPEPIRDVEILEVHAEVSGAGDGGR